MSERLHVVLQPRRPKARMVVDAICAGSGGVIHADLGQTPRGPTAFYGVTAETRPLFEEVRRRGGPWLYVDNGYLASTYVGGRYFRATWCAEQHRGVGVSDGIRLAALARIGMVRLPLPAWRTDGDHVLICTQSEWWYERHGTSLAAWLHRVTEAAREAAPARPLRVRFKPRHRLDLDPNIVSRLDLVRADPERPLADDLAGAWCVVAHSSNALIDGVLAGVPAVATDPCAALAVGTSILNRIANPPTPEGRLPWAAVLADNQWTLNEFRDGTAWRALSAGRPA